MPPIGSTAIVTFVLFGFLLGIVTIWLYAAIRPRYGAGPRSAIMAGLIVFFLAYIYGNAGLTVMGFMPASMMLIIDGWGLVEILIAAVAGAWLYQE
jgi:NhaP-type Na+/H+ or K+/H+ antiporter